MNAIPIITVLHDLVARMKGPYHRLVGRYTQRYLSRAAKKSVNETQRKVLFIAAAGVDETFSALFNVYPQAAGGFAKIILEKRLTKKQITASFHTYLSALLILLGTIKDSLLKETGLSEAEWMRLWCDVFEYDDVDIERFNKLLLPAYQRSGLDGLVASANQSLREELDSIGNEVFVINRNTIRAGLNKDVAAMLRSLRPKKGA